MLFYRIFTAPTTCNGDDAVGIGLGFMANSSVDAVIAPPCKMGALMMSHLSTIYTKPLLGWGYITDAEFTEKEKFPWLTTVVSNAEK
ncbi:hypothetical protein NECAME_09511 [Necator americanus]|uniref:Receptor ligand binding region domain-containing protein n=1 Tax=Necator americanus TaxID=51031 RepID=W2TFD8_NECAM|nr:hypothetical protein NECAME_09511 [Necator americanus]ETN79901.1 hypothetical protein NECAME_09511 [Necator americanus]